VEEEAQLLVEGAMVDHWLLEGGLLKEEEEREDRATLAERFSIEAVVLEERGDGRGRAFELEDDEERPTTSEGGVDSDRLRGGFRSARLESGGGGRPEGAFNA